MLAGAEVQLQDALELAHMMSRQVLHVIQVLEGVDVRLREAIRDVDISSVPVPPPRD